MAYLNRWQISSDIPTSIRRNVVYGNRFKMAVGRSRVVELTAKAHREILLGRIDRAREEGRGCR